MIQRETLNMTIDGLKQHYLDGDFSPAELIEFLWQECESEKSNPIWIHLLSPQEIKLYLDALATQSPNDLPLYGIPFGANRSSAHWRNKTLN